MLRIREVESTDVAATIAGIHLLARQAYYRAAGVEQTEVSPNPDEARITMWCTFIADPDTTVLAAHDDGTLFGFCAWAVSAKASAVAPAAVELLALYTAPVHWGHGAGSLLHDRFIDHLRDSDATCGVLEVWERNEHAMAFYNNRGWRLHGGTRPRADGCPVPHAAIRPAQDRRMTTQDPMRAPAP